MAKEVFVARCFYSGYKKLIEMPKLDWNIEDVDVIPYQEAGPAEGGNFDGSHAGSLSGVCRGNKNLKISCHRALLQIFYGRNLQVGKIG